MSSEQIAEELTNIGLEVEGAFDYTTLKSDLSGVVVGHVVKVWAHPDPEVSKLRLTLVDIGEEEHLQIVCGAPNVAEGQKVPVATIGTRLVFSDGNEVRIKKGKIRGEVSMGMICAEDELGIGTSHDGILVLKDELKPGTPFVEALNPYSDKVLEIGLTPNRVDAACHRGAARDLAARLQLDLKNNQVQQLGLGSESSHISIQIEDATACPRYSGLVIKDVVISESPEWLQNRLKGIGLQPINNVVDVTNYVMHDIGHPMHAFDLKKIDKSTIKVRWAREGEVLVTLDNKERKLDGTELLISDDEKPMALAGVMGGLESSITADTVDILLEAAYFNPSTVRRSARKHQISTDSSFRFERGADPQNILNAMSLAASLITECAGGVVEGSIIDVQAASIEPIEVSFGLEYLASVAGYEIPKARVIDILQKLGFSVSDQNDHLHLVIPTNKPDVTRPIDIVEEVLRVYGYENVPLRKEMKISIPSNKMGKSQAMIDKIISVLNGHEFFQVKTSPFNRESKTEGVAILNPLSAELTHLRSSQLDSGLDALAYNINRQTKSVRLFEVGNEYSITDGNYVENQHLCIWATGDRYTEDSWYDKNRKLDLPWIKGVVEQLLQALSIVNLRYEAVDNDDQWDFGVKLSTGKTPLGVVGKLSAEQCKLHDIEQPVWAVKLDSRELLKAYKTTSIRYSEPGRFPRMIRDLSFVLNEGVTYGQVIEAVGMSRFKTLIDVQCFDIYRGKPLGVGFVSYALRFVFEDKQKTLQDKQVDYAMNQIASALESIGCQIRK